MTILKFPGTPDSGEMARRFGSAPPSLDDLVRDLGEPSDWLDAAVVYLKDKTIGRVEGSVEVSVAALHLVLDHMEQLEAREAEADSPGAA
jgi:hypothetical protein